MLNVYLDSFFSLSYIKRMMRKYKLNDNAFKMKLLIKIRILITSIFITYNI